MYISSAARIKQYRLYSYTPIEKHAVNACVLLKCKYDLLVLISLCSLVYERFSLSLQVEHVQPGHSPKLLPPEGMIGYCILPTVWKRQQPLVRVIQRACVCLFFHLILVKHTVVYQWGKKKKKNTYIEWVLYILSTSLCWFIVTQISFPHFILKWNGLNRFR